MTTLAGRNQSVHRAQPGGKPGVIHSSGRGLLTLFVFMLISVVSALAQQRPGAPDSDFREVESMIQQRRFAEARTSVMEALKRRPSSVEGYNLLAIIQTNQQDFPGAIESLHKALQINARSAKTHNNLGNVYLAAQQPETAEKEFREVLRLDPANSEAHYNLGVLLMMKNSPASAISHFERVRPLTTAAQFNLVRAYFQTKRTADAMRVAGELSEQAKSDVQVHFSLGVLLASEKQYKSAQLELEKADALQPETYEIVFNLGQALLRTADYAKAEVILNRALKLKP